MTELPQDHRLRAQLTNEVHARPYAQLTAPQRVSHLALLSGEAGREADFAHLVVLCRRFDVPPPPSGSSHFMADFGAYRLKWERHSEFASYSVFCDGNSTGKPFSEPAVSALPADWLSDMPGELMVAIQAEIEPRERPTRDQAALSMLFETDNVAGSLSAGGAAAVWMDFALNSDGFGRILIHDRGLRPRQAGRLLQRLLEIETYRIMALLALPLAREGSAMLARANERMLHIAEGMADRSNSADAQALLEDLSTVSVDVEAIAAQTGYRFGAARAYYALVRRRIAELREERLEGLQTIGNFMERRLAPAMQTCESVSVRIDRMSRRLARAGQLLRTRVEINLEEQNRDLLQSMDRRARLQLRLQQTVEGLSVAAITYYLVSLVGYLAKASSDLGVSMPSKLITGVSIPFVAGLVWYGVRRARRLVAGGSVGENSRQADL